MNYFMEIAKLRAARMLWAKLVSKYNPKNPKSLFTNTLSNKWVSQQNKNLQQCNKNLYRSISSYNGRYTGLHTNALDEAIALPTKFSAKIARESLLYLQNNISICNTGDPWDHNTLKH